MVVIPVADRTAYLGYADPEQVLDVAFLVLTGWSVFPCYLKLRIMIFLLVSEAFEEPPSAYTNKLDIDGNEHLEASSTGGDGGGWGVWE
jgi:hypothetical protein